MSRRLNFLVMLFLLCCPHMRAQDRILLELLQETGRDSLWIRKLYDYSYKNFQKQNRLDSLAILAEIVIHESNRLNYPKGQFLGYQLKSESFRDDYPDSTLFYIRQGISILPEDNVKYRLNAYYNVAYTYYSSQRYDSALHNLEKILPETQSIGWTNLILDIYWLIGDVYFDQLKPAQSIDSYLKALTITEETKDSALISTSLSTIGTVYDHLKDYEKALEYSLQSLAIKEEMRKHAGSNVDNNSYDYILNNIGRLYCKLGNYEEGMNYLYRDISQYPSPQNNPCQYQYPAYNLGNAHLRLGRLDSAQYYLETAIRFAEGCSDDYLFSLAAHDLGQLQDQKGNITAARRYFEDALRAAKYRNGPSNELINAAYRLYEMSLAAGDYKNSSKYLLLSNAAKDSLYNLDKANQIARLEMEFSFESQKRELMAASEKEQLILESELERRTIFQYALLAVALLILLIAINFYRSALRRKKANVIISEQNQELSDSAHQIRQLSDFKEGMIGMIAHDMKNSLNTILGLSKSGQQLDDKKANSIQVAGSNILNLVSNMLDVQKFEEAKVTLNKERSLMTSIISRVKESLEPLLQGKSMVLVEETGAITSLNIDPEIIHRVFINLITNSVKYSPAGSRVFIKAEVNSEGTLPRAVISVKDEGSGVDEKFLPNLFHKFTQSKARSLGSTGSSGLGLHFCKLAIEAHGGEIWAESKSGEGLTVSFSIPVESQSFSLAKSGKDMGSNEEPVDAVADSLEEELALIQPYLAQLNALKVYQIKQIKEVISQMEEDGVQTQWQQELWNATKHGNQALFDQIMARAL